MKYNTSITAHSIVRCIHACVSAGASSVLGSPSLPLPRAKERGGGAGVMAGNPARSMGQDHRFVYHMLLLCHYSLTSRQQLLTWEAAKPSGTRGSLGKSPLIKKKKKSDVYQSADSRQAGRQAGRHGPRALILGGGPSLRKSNNFLYIHYDETFGSPLCAGVMHGH